MTVEGGLDGGKLSPWFVYLILCGDGSLYTGITTDVERRLLEHQQGMPRGARYLRGRGPLQVVYQMAAANRSQASILECRIKRLPRLEKQRLIAGELELTL
ncbi:MAG: GIY-YIG nuclease family protein [Gammaproteobacteria bacterium]|nr:GIY-YIG nuclease family protein [Gammaproteobacteria bacterium]